MNPNKKPAERARRLAYFSGIAFEMLAIIGLGVASGLWLDKKLALEIPWFTMLFSLIAVFLALMHTYSTLGKRHK